MSRKSKDLKVGKVFTSTTGLEYEIAEYVNSACILIRFLETGYTSWVQGSHARKGMVKDIMAPSIAGVGYFGEGPYTTVDSQIAPRAYRVWVHMIKRCYDPLTQSRQPTYKGCTVCEEWHNYQVFRAWYDINYIEGMQLDKDKLVPTNKIYSPATCCFIPAQENVEISQSKWYTLISPEGLAVEFFNLNKFCRERGLSLGNTCSVLSGVRNHHKGWTRGY